MDSFEELLEKFVFWFVILCILIGMLAVVGILTGIAYKIWIKPV